MFDSLKDKAKSVVRNVSDTLGTLADDLDNDYDGEEEWSCDDCEEWERCQVEARKRMPRIPPVVLTDSSTLHELNIASKLNMVLVKRLGGEVTITEDEMSEVLTMERSRNSVNGDLMYVVRSPESHVDVLPPLSEKASEG